MSDPVRVTPSLLDVLEVLVAALREDVELHGWAIMKATKRTGPTVYGVLDRLEHIGWIDGRWEVLPPDANRPRRRLYRMTPTGAAAARGLLAKRRPASPAATRAPGLRPGTIWHSPSAGGAS